MEIEIEFDTIEYAEIKQEAARFGGDPDILLLARIAKHAFLWGEDREGLPEIWQ